MELNGHRGAYRSKRLGRIDDAIIGLPDRRRLLLLGKLGHEAVEPAFIAKRLEGLDVQLLGPGL